jgi:hypothetical protein
MATVTRSGSDGSGTIVWMAWPPNPASHWGRCGWSHRERTSSNDSPRSVDRNSADGWVPAQTTSGSAWLGWICQTRSTLAPSSVGKRTAAPWVSVQVRPRSSER